MADNNIQYTFGASDELTPALRAIQGAMLQLSQQTQGLDTTLAQLGTLIQQATANAQAGVGATQNLSTAYLALATSINDQTRAYAAAQAAALDYRKEQDAVRASTHEAAQEAKAAQAIWSQMFAVAGGIGIATSIGQIVRELKDLVVSTVEVSARLEQTRASFAAVAGSVQGGAQQFAFITRTAQRLGIDVFALGDSFKSLSAATRGTALEGPRTEAIFTAIAQAIRVTGGSTQQLHSALLAIEQMVSKGTVSMEELRRQLGNALPGAFSIAARSASLTTQEFEKLVRSGGLIATDFIIPFTSQLLKEFGVGVPQAVNTATAAFAQLSNEVTFLQDRLGEQFLPGVKTVTQALADLARRSREAHEAHTRLLGGVLPDLPTGAEKSGDFSARRQQILEARQDVAAFTLRENIAPLSPLSFFFPPNDADLEAAKKRLSRLLEEERLAILEWNRQMQADITGPGAEALAGGAAVTNVLRILKDGQANLRKIDVATELEPGIDRAQEKVKSWLATIKAANAVLTALPRVTLQAITPEIQAGERALGLTGTSATPSATSSTGTYPYKDLIERLSATRNLDPELIQTLIRVESSFNPNARNQEGTSAKGLGQFTDATWQRYGQGQDVFNPQANITATVNYLGDLLQKFSGNLREALSAYGDPKTVARVLATYGGTGYAPGAATTGTPATSPAPLGAAGTYLEQLRAEEERAKDLLKGDPEARSRTMATGREYLRGLDEEIKRHDDDVKALDRLQASYTKTKEARDEDTISLVMARNPTDEALQQRGQMLLSYVQIRQEMLDSFTALKQQADAQREQEKAQEDYNAKLDETIRLLRTVKTERKEEQLRAAAPRDPATGERVLTGTQQEKLAQVTVLEKAAEQAKEMEKITRDLGRNIERGFTTMWENIMEGGVTSFRSFGETVVKELRSTFAKLSSAIMNMLMDSIAKGLGGDTSGGAGWAGALAKIVIGIGSSLLSSSTTTTTGGNTSLGSSQSGFASPNIMAAHGGVFAGLGDIQPLRLAGGGIVREPSWALIGEDRGHHEAVIPMKDNKYIPVEMTSKGVGQDVVPIYINLDARPHNVLNPMDFRTSPQEIVNIVTQNIVQDGQVRRVIVRHTR